MVFGNRIEAIKAVRALGVAKVETYRNNAGELCVSERVIGLKDAKDIIEAAMALGVREFLAEQLHVADKAAAEALRISTAAQRHFDKTGVDLEF